MKLDIKNIDQNSISEDTQKQFLDLLSAILLDNIINTTKKELDEKGDSILKDIHGRAI